MTSNRKGTKPNSVSLDNLTSIVCWKPLTSNLNWSLIKTLSPQNEFPSAILVLDVDKTIFDFDKNKLIHAEKIQKLVRKATNNNILVVIATARNLFLETKASSLSVVNVLLRIGAHYFQKSYFTNGKDKAFVLNHLQERYFIYDKENAKSKICLVDDQLGYINLCAQHGYKTILVDKEGHYLNLINQFINQFSNLKKKIPVLKTQDDIAVYVKKKFK